MQDIAFWERSVLFLSLACQAALLGRMWKDSLAGRYHFLTFFILAESLQALALLGFKPRTNAYAQAYFISSPVLWLLAYFVVLELYRLILEDYPGISSAGRRGITTCMIVAVATAAGFAIAGSRGTSGRFPLLRLFFAVERSAILGLLVFLVLIQLFLFRYRLKLSRNCIVYSVGYASYFGVGIATDILVGDFLGGRISDLLSLGAAILASLILLAGAFLLTAKGEGRPALDSGDQTADRQRLQQQLTEMNQLLSRVARSGR